MCRNARGFSRDKKDRGPNWDPGVFSRGFESRPLRHFESKGRLTGALCFKASEKQGSRTANLPRLNVSTYGSTDDS